MIPAKNFSKNDFLFQRFQAIYFGLFLRITDVFVPLSLHGLYFLDTWLIPIAL